MAQIGTLPRNEDGIQTVTGILKQRFGERLSTGQALTEQHGHTTTWLTNQAPDAVVFAQSTAEVSEIVKVCADHHVPIIPFGTGTSLEGHVNAPAGGVSIDLSQMNQVLSVHAEDRGMPEGLARVMDIIQTSIAPTAVVPVAPGGGGSGAGAGGKGGGQGGGKGGGQGGGKGGGQGGGTK